MPSDTPIVFSVIVPVWNRVAEIGACIEALRLQDYPADRFEIIVVDNGSTDGTVEAVRAYPGVVLLHEPMPGSYNARNRGIAAARGDWLAFTDSDCQPAADWLDRAADAIAADPGGAIFGGEVAFFTQASDSRICGLHETLFGSRQDMAIRSGGCMTANWVSPADVIHRHGPFDGRFKSGGDFALARKIAAAGLPIRYVPDMVVHHPIRGRLIDLINKRRRLAGGRRQKEGGWPGGRMRFLLQRSCRMPIALLCGRSAGDARLLDRSLLAGLVILLDLVEFIETLAMSLGSPQRRQ